METFWDWMVAEYAGLSLPQVDALSLGTWLVFRRDAFIERKRSTPGGPEWLDDAWRLTQTGMDSGVLRTEFDSR